MAADTVTVTVLHVLTQDSDTQVSLHAYIPKPYAFNSVYYYYTVVMIPLCVTNYFYKYQQRPR